MRAESGCNWEHEMIRGIHHTSISTRDLDRLLDFYAGLVGLQQLFAGNWQDDPSMDNIVGLENTKGRVAMLSAGNAFLELFEYHEPTPGLGDTARRPCDPAITHVCFDVVDVEGEYRRLSGEGVPFLSSPQRTPSVLTCYARDPDGNIVEFQELLNPKSRLQLKEFRRDEDAQTMKPPDVNG
jgi:glyoxylase I family protein